MKFRTEKNYDAYVKQKRDNNRYGVTKGETVEGTLVQDGWARVEGYWLPTKDDRGKLLLRERQYLAKGTRVAATRKRKFKTFLVEEGDEGIVRKPSREDDDKICVKWRKSPKKPTWVVPTAIATLDDAEFTRPHLINQKEARTNALNALPGGKLTNRIASSGRRRSSKAPSVRSSTSRRSDEIAKKFEEEDMKQKNKVAARKRRREELSAARKKARKEELTKKQRAVKESREKLRRSILKQSKEEEKKQKDIKFKAEYMESSSGSPIRHRPFRAVYTDRSDSPSRRQLDIYSPNHQQRRSRKWRPASRKSPKEPTEPDRTSVLLSNWGGLGSPSRAPKPKPRFHEIRSNVPKEQWEKWRVCEGCNVAIKGTNQTLSEGTIVTVDATRPSLNPTQVHAIRPAVGWIDIEHHKKSQVVFWAMYKDRLAPARSTNARQYSRTAERHRRAKPRRALREDIYSES